METLQVPIETTPGNHFISNYPPFSVWTPEQIPRLEQALSAPVDSTQPLSVYVHVPFCRQRCHYCYFRVYPRRTAQEVAQYVGAVLGEWALYHARPAIESRPVASVYFGGGTPSYLSERELERLVSGLRTGTDWSRVEEFTIECEPKTVSPGKFRLLRDLGVSRVSLGFQTLNDKVLQEAGRELTVRSCLDAFEAAREAGFDQLNIDLLAGLPGETTASWDRTVERVIELAPECVTIYQLELTFNSNLYSFIRTGKPPSLPDWSTKRDWARGAFTKLEQAGYTIASAYMAVRDPARWRFAYTVDHFWRGQDLVALGESSFGHVQGVHYQNQDTFDAYLASIRQGKLPCRRAHALNAEEKLRREAILQLKTGALDTAYFRKKFGIELTEHFAQELRQLGDLVLIDGETIRLTPQALPDIDWYLPAFYLPEHRGVRYT